MRIGLAVTASLVLCADGFAALSEVPPYETALREVVRAYDGRVFASGVGYLRQYASIELSTPIAPPTAIDIGFSYGGAVFTTVGYIDSSSTTWPTHTTSSSGIISSPSPGAVSTWVPGTVIDTTSGSWTGGVQPGSETNHGSVIPGSAIGTTSGSWTGGANYGSLTPGSAIGTTSGSWTGGANYGSLTPGSVIDTSTGTPTGASLTVNTGTVAVPEPTAALMAGPALAMLVRRRRSPGQQKEHAG